MSSEKKIAITMGDPAGIGPEIIVKALKEIDVSSKNIVVIGCKDIFSPVLTDIELIDTECDISKIQPGKETAESGRASFLALEKACNMAQNGEIQAIVTAPLSKNAINLAGYNYSGQTEVLEKFLGKQGQNKAEMLFVADDFRILLLTRHISLSEVSKKLTKEHIVKTVNVLYSSLKKDFNIESPKLAICGLNPHSGEAGLIGREEIDIIVPAMETLKNSGINIEGLFPADTLFVKAGKAYLNREKQPYDCYIACYHDQGLTPIKVLAMDKTVNTTIGLPVIRTSPAHGTAFDIAGKGIADCSSMKAAIKLALGTL